jgi:hypothetical protein
MQRGHESPTNPAPYPLLVALVARYSEERRGSQWRCATKFDARCGRPPVSPGSRSLPPLSRTPRVMPIKTTVVRSGGATRVIKRGGLCNETKAYVVLGHDKGHVQRLD